MTRPPVSIAEQLIEMHARRGPDGKPLADDALEAAIVGMRSARELAEQAAAARQTILADASMPPDARSIAARKAVTSLSERAAKNLDVAATKLQAAIGRIQETTAAPAPPDGPVAVQVHAEVRAALARMSPDKRGETIASAIANGDDTIVSAVMGAPSFLSGLSDVEREMRREQWRRARHADAWDREQRLSRAMQAINRGGRALTEWCSSIMTGGDAEQRQQAAAQAAANAKEAEAA